MKPFPQAGRLVALWVALLYVAVALLFFLPGSLHPATAIAGNTSTPDWAGAWHALWLIGSSWSSPSDLVVTRMLYFPVGHPFLATYGNFVDLLFAALWQGMIGAVAGYNVAVWLMVAFLGFAVHRCAVAFGSSNAAAFVAGIAILASAPVSTEIANGRVYDVVALAFAALFFAQTPGFADGDVKAAARAGLWFGLTALAHWFSAVLVGLFIIPPLVFLFARPAIERRRIILMLCAAGAVAAAVVGGPFLFQALRISDVPGVQSGFWQSMFPGKAQPVGMVLHAVVMNSMTPVRLVLAGKISVFILLLAALSLPRCPGRHLVLWGSVFVIALLIVWEPALRPETPGHAEKSLGLPFPYAFLSYIVPFFWRLTWVNRVALFVVLPVAILAARYVHALYSAPARPKWARMSVLASALLLLAAESLVRGMLPFTTSPAYAGQGPLQSEAARHMAAMAQSSGGAVISYPAMGRTVYAACFFQTIHGRPMLNGYKGLREEMMPAALKRIILPNELVGALSRAPTRGGRPIPPGDVKRLRDLGYTDLMIHLDVLGANAGDFTQSALGCRLRAALGAPEEHGCLLVYRLASRAP